MIFVSRGCTATICATTVIRFGARERQSVFDVGTRWQVIIIQADDMTTRSQL